MNLKATIFSLFSAYDKRTDTNKDDQNKGTFERFNEMLGEDLDEDLLPLIDNLLDYTIVPMTVLDKFLPYLEEMLGSTLQISGDNYIRRKFLANTISLYKVKGTKLSYYMVFKLLGFSKVEVVEDFSALGFDSPFTFDDPARTLDNGRCAPCTPYDIILEGEAALDDDLNRVIIDIIKFIEPINATLRKATYNDIPLSDKIVSFYIAANGDLIYRNTNDPSLTFEVRSGDLLVDGPNKGKYRLDDNNNMKYNGN